jgi:hypothetical protein
VLLLEIFFSGAAVYIVESFNNFKLVHAVGFFMAS